MAHNNPFCLSFGREPDRFVERTEAYTQITDTLNSVSPSNNTYLIIGVRGSGKTVLMTTISNEFRDSSDWIVLSLNPGRNMLEMFAAGLYEEAKLQKYFIDAELNLSKFGIGFNIQTSPPISDIQIAIEKMVKIVENHGKRILLTIDDVTKSNNLISFSSAYQDLLSKNHQIFLIMTGLYDNIYSIQTDKRCSFLLRAEQIVLKPLSFNGIRALYQQTFNCDTETAKQMALLTKGYSYAFQVLGFIMWDKECSIEDALEAFDQRMALYCYEKIWEDLSESERTIVYTLAQNGKMKTKDLIEKIGSASNILSVHRDRLIKKGIIDGSEHGFISLILPRFDIFVLNSVFR